jgi:hypothetical protein
MTTALVYDTASEAGVAAIPAKAKGVMGYPDGHFRTFVALVRRFFPHAHCVSIGVMIGNLAAFSDVEDGNPINTPELVRQDFERKRQHGVWRPGYYADHDHMVRIVIPGLMGIPRGEYRLILARWDGIAKLVPGYEGKQFTNNRRNGREGLYDTTIVDVAAFFPHAAKHKVTRPAVHPKVAGATLGTALTAGIWAILHAAGVHITPVETVAIGTALAGIGGTVTPTKGGTAK